MNWDAIGAVGEVLGALVVIGSLIYLSRQIRQNTDLGRAAAQREVNTAFNTVVYNLNSDPEIFRKALLDFEGLTKTEQFIAHNSLAPFANHLDQVIRMSQLGLESADSVKVFGDICIAVVTTPGGRIWWDQINHLIPTEAAAYIERRLGDPPETLPPPMTESLSWFRPDEA